MSVESRRELRDRIKGGEIDPFRIELDPYDHVAKVGHAATLAEKVSDKSFGKSSDLSKAFSKLGTIAAVGSTIIDILETGDVTKELSGLAGSALTGAALGAGMGALTGNPLIIGAAAIAGGIAGEKGVEAAIDWLRKSDAAKIEDIDSVIEWIKKPKRYQDDPNFSPPEELDKGGAPAAIGSSRAPGQRGSINPVDAHNALDSLAAENALYDGSLFRHVTEKERARLKGRDKATDSSDEETPGDTGAKDTGHPPGTSPGRGTQKAVEQELPQGGAPAATGSSRPLGRRGSIKAGDEYNALDALAEENARSGGALFRDAINKHLEQQKQQEQESTPHAEREISESARQQRDQPAHASGESLVDSQGRRTRGPYDLEGPEAALRLDATATQDATGAQAGVQVQAGDQALTAEQMQAATTMPLSTRYLQYGLPGSRYHAYLEFLDNEKNKARQTEGQTPIRAPRAQSRATVPLDLPNMRSQAMQSQHIHAQGMRAQGMRAQGMRAQGMRAQGMRAQGTPFDQSRRVQAPILPVRDSLGPYRNTSEFIAALLGRPYPSRAEPVQQDSRANTETAPLVSDILRYDRSAHPNVTRSAARNQEELEDVPNT